MQLIASAAYFSDDKFGNGASGFGDVGGVAAIRDACPNLSRACCSARSFACARDELPDLVSDVVITGWIEWA